MKSHLKKIFLASTGLLLAATVAGAQEMSTSLPLTSVGDRLMWSVGDQNLNLDVPVAGQVRLELFSPRIDPADYRSADYYGDEQYAGGENAATTFTLVDSEGKTVLSRTFTPGVAAWETLFDQALPAGQYRLKVETQGNAKNTFAVRLAGVSAAVSADRLSVNIHSQTWKPVLKVSTDGQPYVLRMYDGDGPSELEARLVDTQGNVYPLTVSGDLAWTDLPLPAPAGEYTVELRQPATARQFSNTVSFSMTRQGTGTPITLTRVDQTGLLRLSAELVLPTSVTPTQTEVSVGEERLAVDGQTERKVAAGNYIVTPVPVAGAEVSIDHTQVTVPRGGVGEAKVQIRPQVQLTLEADKREVCIGDTVTLTAQASTAYAGDLPLDLNLDAPGLSLSGESTLKGTLKAGQDGVLRLTGRATQAGPLTVSAQLGPWSKSQSVSLNVLPNTTALELSRAELTQAQAGDEVIVKLSLKNTASQPVDYTLTDQVPEGLQALDKASFSGRLEAGETRELNYRAKVVAQQAGDLNWQASLNTPACPVPQQVAGKLQVTVPTPPAQSRSSTVTLPFDVPRESKLVTIQHTVPQGADYVAGSSKLDGKPVPDPVRSPAGNYYWNVPAPTGNGTEEGAAVRGVLTYDLAHTGALGGLAEPSLSVTLPGQRSELLQGKIDKADLALAVPLKAETAKLTENAGAVKLPLADSVIRLRDRITVTVEGPQAQDPDLTVNGKPVSADLIGTNVQDSGRGIQRLTYVGVPIVDGPNVLRYNGQEIKVYKVGATSTIEITPESLIADGSTPLRLRIRTLDAQGYTTGQPTVTLNSNLEPRVPDASTTEGGYQLRLVDGEGVLELQPQTAPTTLNLQVQNGLRTEKYTYEVKPDNSRVGVGNVSVTAGLGSGFSVQNDVRWQARAYYEGPLAGGKLYVAADKDGLPTDTNVFVRYPIYGDASTQLVPLQGIDPVAFTYDHPDFRAEYRRNSLPIDVLPVNETFTALTAYSKANPKLSGFVAYVPRDLVKNVPLEFTGTRIIHLPNAGISEGSESLVLVTLERGTGKIIKQVTLVRNVDYTIDPSAGLVVLARTLDPVDIELNEQRLFGSYRLANALSQRSLAYGVQLKTVGEHYSVGAAAVSLDNVVTLGARATYDDGKTRADGLVAYSGGFQASASVSGKPNDRLEFSVRGRYQQTTYNEKGLGRLADGLSVEGNANVRLTERLRVVADGEYHNVPQNAVATDPLTELTRPLSRQGGSVAGRVVYDFKPFSVGLGAKYAFGDIYGIGAVGSIGYAQGRTSINVVHTQPFTGNLPATTEVSTRFGVGRNVNLGFTDKLTWGLGHAAALTLDTMVGNTNYAIGYELPTAGGQGNRARFGVTTTLPLTANLGLGLRGSATYDLARKAGEVGAGADLNYKTDKVSATVGGDATYTPAGFGVVMRAGVSGTLTDHLTLTADGLYENKPSAAGDRVTGERLSVGYAYRNRTFSSLGYLRYLNGSLAATRPEMNSGLSAEYRQPTWAVRAGFDNRLFLNDRASYTWQAYGGGTVYLNEWLGVGGWVRSLNQPATKTSLLGYGLEGSLRVLPGAWVSAGYNFKGFDGLPSGYTYTKPGAYLRLDVTLDETAGEKK